MLPSSLLHPDHLWSRAEVLTRPCPVPAAPGIYAWYFREIPPGVPTTGCIVHNGLTLVYVGISPGKRPSRQTLRQRIRYHYRGNAEGSTLRLTLGCLLGFTLRCVGSGRRLTFDDAESALSDWMAENAFVAWHPCERPWELEEHLISELRLPLNLDQNAGHEFHGVLTQLRRDARERARGEHSAAGMSV